MFNNKTVQRETDCTTIIAKGVRVVGDIHFSGSLHLEGTVEGTVRADGHEGALFTLNPSGRVCGQVCAPNVVIDGEVEGDIHCDTRLELAPGARITGDVHYKVLQIAAGATVNGRMVHESDAPRRLTQINDPDQDTAEAPDAEVARA